jgi:hypothetical protein
MSTCSFCSSSDSERTYVEGEGAYICSACIEVMYEMVIKQGIKNKADLDSIQGGDMAKASLEFKIKRGVVDMDSIEDDEVKATAEKCLKLCKAKKNSEAVDILLPLMSFEWSWGSCDGDASDVFEETDDIFFECNKKNTSLQVGETDGTLIITASAMFQVAVRDGVSADEITEWLDNNSAYACGWLSGGWGYSGSDGDNVIVTKVK